MAQGQCQKATSCMVVSKIPKLYIKTGCGISLTNLSLFELPNLNN